MPFNNRCCLVTNLNLTHSLVASTFQLQGSMPFNNQCCLVTNLNLTHSLVASTSQLHSITWEALTNYLVCYCMEGGKLSPITQFVIAWRGSFRGRMPHIVAQESPSCYSTSFISNKYQLQMITTLTSLAFINDPLVSTRYQLVFQ